MDSQVSVASLRSNVSSLLTGGESSFLDPADVLRNAMAISAVLEHAPDPASAEELEEVIELKVCGRWISGAFLSFCAVLCGGGNGYDLFLGLHSRAFFRGRPEVFSLPHEEQGGLVVKLRLFVVMRM